jgi:SAM-dependent methyltransferase
MVGAVSTTEYDLWHQGLADDEPEPTPTAPWHELAKPELGDLTGLAVLEAGCGRGAFAGYLADQGARVTACDVSPVAVGLANRLLAGRAEAVVADLQQLPFPDGSFDVVASLETVEHLPDPVQGMRELVRVLKPGGKLVLTGPNYLNLAGVLRIALRLKGDRYTEMGQPVNQPLLLFQQAWRLRRLGCRIEKIAGSELPIPPGDTLRLPRPQWLFRWVAMNTMIVARKPA